MPAASFSAPRNPTIRTRSVWGSIAARDAETHLHADGKGFWPFIFSRRPRVAKFEGGLDVRPCLVDIITQIRSLSKAFWKTASWMRILSAWLGLIAENDLFRGGDDVS